MAAVSKECTVRDGLLSQFIRELDHYNLSFCALLEKMTTDKATGEAEALYQICIEAKNALQEHEREHGCFV
jgi:hypothetical protein